jgi:AcrR family transcriptional regulator
MKTLTITPIPEDVPMQELTQLGGVPRERADAARNREKVLEAASKLFAERGIERVSMDDVAAEAGVGKGTLFRRFGDRAGLAHALLDESERDFQEELLHGSPPLGPGAPPCERIKAFGAGRFRILERHYALIAAAEAGPAARRFVHPVYAAHRAHLYILARQADRSVDPEYVADVLLNSLTAEFFSYLRHGRGLSLEEIETGFCDLVDRFLAG